MFMSEKTKVLIAEDEGIIREALCMLVNSYDGMTVAGEASNGREAVETSLKTRPDVILMDLKMPLMDGIEAAKKIKSVFPDIKIIALTAVSDGRMMTDALSEGFDGFVIKKGSGGELKNAIRSVMDGRRYICSEAAIIIADSYLAEKKKKSLNPFTNLSNVELEILNLICGGLRAQEIAKKLGISKKTVEKYRDNLRLKTGSATAAELVAAYLEFKRTS